MIAYSPQPELARPARHRRCESSAQIKALLRKLNFAEQRVLLQVSLVINYDLPNSRELYIHRIGRSGRYGRKGVAINFVRSDDVRILRDIEQFYSTQIDEMVRSPFQCPAHKAYRTFLFRLCILVLLCHRLSAAGSLSSNDLTCMTEHCGLPCAANECGRPNLRSEGQSSTAALPSQPPSGQA